jgi:hypothetical protein
MPLKKQKLSLLLIFPFLSVISLSIHSQPKNDETLLYNWFDTTAGKESSEINNGTLYNNIYKPTNKNHNFYVSNQYTKGAVTYNGQKIYSVDLKYDIVNDELILKREGDYNFRDINLIKDKIESFTINNNFFVHLKYKLEITKGRLEGFYEQNYSCNSFTFYIKHHKKNLKNLNTGSIIYEFYEDNSFYIEQKNSVYPINSKKDLISIFPKQKKQIDDYYNENNNLKNDNLNLFYENLIPKLNNTQTIEVK